MHSRGLITHDAMEALYDGAVREVNRPRVLQIIADHIKPHQRAFVGVIDPLDARVETAQEVCDRVLEAARFLSPAQIGTTDDCGFSPFADDISTTRQTAFAKIRSRVEGTQMASKLLFGHTHA